MLHTNIKHWNKYTTETICCSCGVKFQAYIYNLKRGWGKYCTRSCSKKNNSNRTGHTFTAEQRVRISTTLKKKYEQGLIVSPFVNVKYGEESPNWRGGKTKVGQMLRRDLSYKKWRIGVLERDDYTCQMCNKRGGKLQVDHIKRFADFPELRLELNNGRTLCIPCHKTTGTWGASKKL